MMGCLCHSASHRACVLVSWGVIVGGSAVTERGCLMYQLAPDWLYGELRGNQRTSSGVSRKWKEGDGTQKNEISV